MPDSKEVYAAKEEVIKAARHWEDVAEWYGLLWEQKLEDSLIKLTHIASAEDVVNAPK